MKELTICTETTPYSPGWCWVLVQAGWYRGIAFSLIILSFRTVICCGWNKGLVINITDFTYVFETEFSENNLAQARSTNWSFLDFFKKNNKIKISRKTVFFCCIVYYSASSSLSKLLNTYGRIRYFLANLINQFLHWCKIEHTRQTEHKHKSEKCGTVNINFAWTFYYRGNNQFKKIFSRKQNHYHLNFKNRSSENTVVNFIRMQSYP